MSTVLVVDQEPAILRTMGVNLRARGYRAQFASSGHVALAMAARQHPDAVVIDPRLSDMDGIEVVRGLRGWSTMPIIVLSARAGEEEKVFALDAGANDYVTKPFGMEELMARVRVALRRPAGAAETAVVATSDFSIDLGEKRVTKRDGCDVRLTATEWQIVELFARNPTRLVTHRQLLADVWGLRGIKSNLPRVFLMKIRRKLEPEPSQPRYFITEHGIGLRFVPAVI